MKILLSILLSCQAMALDPDQAMKKSEEVYLATPYSPAKEPDFEGKLYVPDLPFSSVCMSPSEYRKMRSSQIFASKVTMPAPCIDNSPTWEDYLTAFALGAFAGALLDRYVSKP